VCSWYRCRNADEVGSEKMETAQCCCGGFRLGDGASWCGEDGGGTMLQISMVRELWWWRDGTTEKTETCGGSYVDVSAGASWWQVCGGAAA